MKKVNFLKVITLIFIICIICISYIVYADKEIKQYITESNIFNKYGKKIDYDDIQIEEIIETGAELPIINNTANELLKSFDKNIENIKEATKIYDKSLDREVTRISLENYEIDIDEDGDIVKYKNFDDYSIVDKYKKNYNEGESVLKTSYKIIEREDLEDIISLIESKNDLNGYKIIDCSNNIEGKWILTWCKDYGNNLINSYDCVNVVIDAKDGSTMLFAKNKIEPNMLEPIIQKSKAFEIVKTKFPNFNIIEENIQLDFFRPNFYWNNGGPYEDVNFIRLSWRIICDNSIIYIDAETGENLGGSQFYSSDCGRAMQVVNGEGREHKVSLAYSGLNTLGYNQSNYPPVTWSISQEDINWVLSRNDLYGLYLCCHGRGFSDYSTLADEGDSLTRKWEVSSKQSFGNWHFVFLDACVSSRKNHFAPSFGISGAGKCIVGWNVAVNESTSYDFCKRFWPRCGTMSVYDNVITSLLESRNYGYNVPGANICDPGFYGDQNYWGWAW